MKRAVWVFVAAIGVVSPGLAQAEQQKPQSAPAAAAAPAAQSAAPAAAGKHILYTFPDEASLKAFTELWGQRQGIFVRLSVLQAYTSEERAALTDVDQKLSTTYHMNMDALANYALDTDRKVLIERPAPAQAPAPSAPALQQP